MNEWLERQMTSGFEVYSTALAMKLHFTSTYDYVAYHGKTNTTLERYIAKGTKFTGPINRLGNRLKALEIPAQPFILATYRNKVAPIQFMNAQQYFDNYTIWNQRYGTIAKWVDTGESIMRALVAQDVTPAKLTMDKFLDEVIARISANKIEPEFLLYVDHKTRRYVTETYFPKASDFVTVHYRDLLTKLRNFYF